MSHTEEATIRATAAQFFNAIEAGDIAAMKSLLTLDAEIWHNTDELVTSPDHTARVLAGMVERITNLKYSDRRLDVFPGGFVQQHVLEGNRIHDGEKVRLPAAIIARVENGKIRRIDEYFDTVHQATFRKFVGVPLRL
ncbi:uncharacterized protein A1O5_02124 [Cladophialophora psammophila CBS 110553]|uniref:SnoaL-like domain-containing protein n=1 Tax=Cladophialophora psammophila CBS 110553 TaxID=1182543 RepID=W9X5G1_9EURO|nr:uncharacterized protein A1O5_02124 [Cladophialophora psammophila CBS 110553]EXJ75428.1 hypothetical protein A1O5_02124 [Cladophialophora psammophila CBS 110553]